MKYLRRFLILTLFSIPTLSFSDEKLERSKFFVENLGKEVVEKYYRYGGDFHPISPTK